MLIPDSEGRYYYHDAQVLKYHAFVNSHLQIVEDIFTDDGEWCVEKHDWDDLNDVEKYVALQRGWDIPNELERRKAEKQEHSFETEIIPFPLSS